MIFVCCDHRRAILKTLISTALIKIEQGTVRSPLCDQFKKRLGEFYAY